MGKRLNTDLDVRGDLQIELTNAIWRLGEATIDGCARPSPRSDALPTRPCRPQTVLNRLVERGLLVRERSGRAFVYRPKVDEAEYVARSIAERLAGASPD